jgi:sugar phosphate isomerase/epimerase
MSHQTRREFSKMALVALPAAAGMISLIPSLRGAAAPAATATRKPNSNVRGVHIGMNAPYNYGNLANTGEEILALTVALDVSALELRSGPVEAFMGAPGAAGGRGGAAQLPGATPTQQAAYAALGTSTAEFTAAVTAARTALTTASLKSPVSAAELADKAAALSAAETRLAAARSEWLAKTQASPDRLNAAQVTAVLQANGGPAPAGAARGGGGGRGAASPELRQWRLAAPLARAREFRQTYENAGVFIEIMKFDGVPAMTDEELNYAFTLAKACGARAISCEMAADQLKRVGGIAAQHQMLVGWHNHAALTSDVWETGFADSKFNGANVDIGHFVAGQNKSPLEFITKYHDRVTHIHVKDRKMGSVGGATTPFGEGDTPIVEILRTIRDNRWPIQATLEIEYPTPAGSDRRTELVKSMDYCRKALA